MIAELRTSPTLHMLIRPECEADMAAGKAIAEVLQRAGYCAMDTAGVDNVPAIAEAMGTVIPLAALPRQ